MRCRRVIGLCKVASNCTPLLPKTPMWQPVQIREWDPRELGCDFLDEIGTIIRPMAIRMRDLEHHRAMAFDQLAKFALRQIRRQCQPLNALPVACSGVPRARQKT